MEKYSFLNDYSEGAHPRMLNALVSSNLEQHTPYGYDDYSEQAKQLIKNEIDNHEAGVYFVTGGTQANLILISSALRAHQGVISTNIGHIALRETGAIEATGHKIITFPSTDGKIRPADLVPILDDFDFGPHVVRPKMIYISNSTEIGSIYKKAELKALYEFAQANNLYVFLDGARLAFGLTASDSDVTLKDVAAYTDAFTLGGTKNGALVGEGIVITHKDLIEEFPFNLKQKGALLAKGRLLGLQFLEFFKDGLYYKLATYANTLAAKIVAAANKMNFEQLTPSTTNQVFLILPESKILELEKEFNFYRWKKIDEEFTAVRIVTSWATDEKAVDRFVELLSK